MREIKFRAWDKQTKRLYQVQNLQFFGKNDTVDACWTNGVDFDGESTLGEPELNNLHNLVLMQYTGKKDINGVEIYEGDILACYGGFTDLGCTLQVNVEVEDIYEMAFIIRNCDRYEVIGNIYEKPELLED